MGQQACQPDTGTSGLARDSCLQLTLSCVCCASSSEACDAPGACMHHQPGAWQACNASNRACCLPLCQQCMTQCNTNIVSHIRPFCHLPKHITALMGQSHPCSSTQAGVARHMRCRQTRPLHFLLQRAAPHDTFWLAAVHPASMTIRPRRPPLSQEVVWRTPGHLRATGHRSECTLGAPALSNRLQSCHGRPSLSQPVDHS